MYAQQKVEYVTLENFTSNTNLIYFQKLAKFLESTRHKKETILSIAIIKYPKRFLKLLFNKIITLRNNFLTTFYKKNSLKNHFGLLELKKLFQVLTILSNILKININIFHIFSSVQAKLIKIHNFKKIIFNSPTIICNCKQ